MVNLRYDAFLVVSTNIAVCSFFFFWDVVGRQTPLLPMMVCRFSFFFIKYSYKIFNYIKIFPEFIFIFEEI